MKNSEVVIPILLSLHQCISEAQVNKIETEYLEEAAYIRVKPQTVRQQM
jgi:hypothetical protein